MWFSDAFKEKKISSKKTILINCSNTLHTIVTPETFNNPCVLTGSSHLCKVNLVIEVNPQTSLKIIDNNVLDSLYCLGHPFLKIPNLNLFYK